LKAKKGQRYSVALSISERGLIDLPLKNDILTQSVLRYNYLGLSGQPQRRLRHELRTHPDPVALAAEHSKTIKDSAAVCYGGAVLIS